MQLNEGRFLQNGRWALYFIAALLYNGCVCVFCRCGYVLMPDCMLYHDAFNPFDSTSHKTEPLNIVLTVSLMRNVHVLYECQCVPEGILIIYLGDIN